MNRKLELKVSTPDGSVKNSYIIEWPTIQQIIDIESMKLTLSKGKYVEMIMTGTRWMQRTLNYIDMCSYLSVMCPKLLVDMKVDPNKLDVVDAENGLMKVYSTQFVPWWNEYDKIVNKIENPDKESESKTPESNGDGKTATE